MNISCTFIEYFQIYNKKKVYGLTPDVQDTSTNTFLKVDVICIAFILYFYFKSYLLAWDYLLRIKVKEAGKFFTSRGLFHDDHKTRMVN